MVGTPQFVRIRAVDPGTLYNLGNLLGFVAGLAVSLSMASPGSGAAPWERVAVHLMGSPAALALTAATAVFFWGGIVYRRAWTAGVLTDPDLNRLGDLLSGVGAIILGTGLLLLGNPWLAASAGAMHAVGKFGSALSGMAPSHPLSIGEHVGALCKDLVLASRVPAVLVGASALWQPQGAGELLLALSFIACCVIWGVADWLLLSPRGVIRTASATLHLSSRG